MELELMRYRFGVFDGELHTFTETDTYLGITEDEARELEKSATLKSKATEE